MEMCVKNFIEEVKEKTEAYGSDTLSNRELLLLLCNGRGRKSGKDLLEQIDELLSTEEGLFYLYTASIDELAEIVGKSVALQIKVSTELSKRIRSFKKDRYVIKHPEDAANLVMEDMRYLKKEHLKLIMLNIKNEVIGQKTISIGSLNSSIIHPREVYAEAIKKSAASIIIVHNHPSGDPSPSKEDINVTERLKECGKLLGIELLDHVIIGNGNHISLKERCIL